MEKEKKGTRLCSLEGGDYWTESYSWEGRRFKTQKWDRARWGPRTTRWLLKKTRMEGGLKKQLVATMLFVLVSLQIRVPSTSLIINTGFLILALLKKTISPYSQIPLKRPKWPLQGLRSPLLKNYDQHQMRHPNCYNGKLEEADRECFNGKEKSEEWKQKVLKPVKRWEQPETIQNRKF